MYVTLKRELEVTASVYSMGTTSQAKKMPFFLGLSSLVSAEKAVFHRKKVVQLSRNNHCHAILKSRFLLYAWLWFMRPGISPILYSSIKMMSENQLWVAGGKIQNVDAPFLSLFPPAFAFFHPHSWKISNFLFQIFPSSVPLATCFLDNYF
jgi:hypothetical protein